MKICAIICEYNPFHNGHLYQLRQAKALSGADAVLCIMSGNFVQRGEPAILDKYTRAKHAILAGADAVLELPAVFSTSNAEIFAKGAVKIIASIPAVSTLCFGAETADKLAFVSAARYLNNEPKEVSMQIKESVSQGVSYAKARANAFAGFIPFELLTSSNNILALEYTKAILLENADIDVLPVQRLGSSYNDAELHEEFSSATAIRKAFLEKKSIQENVPDFVYNDLQISTPCINIELLEKYAVLNKTNEDLASVLDCTEGLENAFKRVAETEDSFTTMLTSARYTTSRIRRIALQNLLNITEEQIRSALNNDLYLRVLAVKKNRNDVLSALSESRFPLVIRAHDEQKLNATALQCFNRDIFAEKIYALLKNNPSKKEIFI